MLTRRSSLTVGLGIGATTVIFARCHAALLRPLPYADPGRLVRIYTDTPPKQVPILGRRLSGAAEPADQLRAGRRRTPIAPMTFSDGSVAERLRGRLVSWTYFALLGIQPGLGPRVRARPTAGPGSPPVGRRQRRILACSGSAGGPTSIGKPIRLDGADYTRRRRPAAHGRAARTAGRSSSSPRSEPPPRRKGPFFYHGRSRRLRSRRRNASAAADELRAINRRTVPDLAGVVSGRESHVEHDAICKTHVVGDVQHDRRPGARRGGARVADRVRERVEPADRARDQPAPRARGARGARRLARARRAISARRKRAARDRRRVRSAWPGARRRRAAARASAPRYFPRTQEIALDGAGLVAARRAHRRRARCSSALVPALHGSGGPVDESLRSSGRSSTGSLSRAPRCGGSSSASQFAIATPLLVVAGLLLVSLNAAAARRSRLRHAQRRQRVDSAAGGAVRRAAGASARSGTSCSGASRRCPACRGSRVRRRPPAERRRQLQQLRSRRLPDARRGSRSR